ncbi:MAG: hypothetical protein EOQ93_31960 [Mesorhizobium sp.]|nr:MAG: hypothetical protein EOQ93_31960 [Mesorhizobium sp.]
MLLGVERPHLFVDNVIPTVPVEDKWFDLPENKIPLFELRFDTINFGRTPAIVSEMKTGILLGPLPAVPRFFPGEVHQSEWVISPDGGRRTGIAFIREIVTHAKLNEMWISQTYIEGREPHHIWFYGTVLYESVNGSKDEIGFIYRYLPHGKSFHLENIPGYTFRRRDVRQR